MHETNSHHFPIGRNSDKMIPNSTELSERLSDISTTESKTKKHKSMDSKKHKDKVHSKPVDILKRIFSHKSNSSKLKPQKDFSTAKAIAQSTIDIFAQNPPIHNELYINPTTSISTGHLNTDEYSQVSQSNENKFHIIDNHISKVDCVPICYANLISTETSSVTSYQFPDIPKIVKETPSNRSSPLLTEYHIKSENNLHLSLPQNDRSRKSSENDSAVDLKFNDDSSDQDRTNISETGSSRCPSSTLVQGDDVSLSNNKIPSILQVPNAVNKIKRTESSSWRKLKAAFIWTPFIQQCARHRYPWIQIAGHQGNFKPGEQGTILKKYTGRESICLQMMNEDVLVEFVPQFKSEIDYEGERYICMQDLLAKFNQPSLIDIKMGTRTYLEEELVKAKHCPKPRQDMYEKMMEIDENEPTEHEHSIKAILKPRYMQWRETLSSTITLGFRIEGVKKFGIKNDKVVGTQSRDYKRTKDREEVKQILVDFIDDKRDILETFIKRLCDLKIALTQSMFFWDHEFIGSSLLFVHDKNGNANAWMIDFGKTIPLPPNCKIDHYSTWIEGNHEDGYLFGLENLLNIFLEIHSDITPIETN